MYVRNASRRRLMASQVRVCSTAASRARGLMFSAPIKDGACVLTFPRERRIELHMYFVFFPIDVMFLDKDKRVVELKERFQPFTTYHSSRKAKYAVELQEGTVARSKTRIGDRIDFLEVLKNGKSKIVGAHAPI